MLDSIRDFMQNGPIPLWGWVVINLLLWGTVITVLVKFGGMIFRAIISFFLPYWLD